VGPTPPPAPRVSLEYFFSDPATETTGGMAAMKNVWVFLLVIPSLAWADEKAFQIGGPTVSIAATTTTARAQFQASASSPNARIYNSATTPVFVACGDVAITASATASMPVAGGAVNIINCPQQYIAAISATTATVYVTPGTGGDAQ
jgi:hypothetical protein